MRVLIDPGHGGDASGRVVGKIAEKDFNLSFALDVAQALQSHGHIVSMTRFNDADVSLEHRVFFEGVHRPDLFLSIHCNGFSDLSAHGMEVFTSPGDTAADPIAEKIINAMQEEFAGRKWRMDTLDGDKDKEENFYVLRNTCCAAVLVEVEFMTNPDALEFLSQQSTGLKLGRAIVTALKEG